MLENLTVDRARRRWREVPLPVPDTREAEAATPNPETALLARELVARVTDALGSIPEGRQKEVFRLRYAEGMALGDIADDFLDGKRGFFQVNFAGFYLGNIENVIDDDQ